MNAIITERTVKRFYELFIAVFNTRSFEVIQFNLELDHRLKMFA